MSDSRREILRRTSAVAISAISLGLAGCLSRDNSDDDLTVGEVSTPNPIINSTSAAEPSIVDTVETDSSDTDDTRYDAEIHNNGDTGEVGAVLFWVDSVDDDGDPEDVTRVDQQIKSIASGESSTFTIHAQQPDDVEGYWFASVPQTITVEVENVGGDGDVTVNLFNGGGVTDSSTITMESDAVETVALSQGDVVQEQEWRVEAVPTEQQ